MCLQLVGYRNGCKLMADSRILPAARARMVDSGGLCTAEFYRFLQRLATDSNTTTDQQAAIDRIEMLLTDGGAYLPKTTMILGGEAVSVTGTLANGVVSLNLVDVIPEDGGILQRFATDRYGRVTERGSATTNDLTEGSNHLYFTTDRAKDAAGSALKDSADIDLSYDAVARKIAADLIATGVVAGTYGGGVAMPIIQVDAKGRIVSASVQSLIAGSGVIFTTDPVTGAVTISINTTPASTRVTEDGSQRVTRSGDIRVTR